MTNDEHIRELLPKLQHIASEGGSMHAAWDIIFDAKAWLDGRPTWLSGDRESVAAKIISMSEAALK